MKIQTHDLLISKSKTDTNTPSQTSGKIFNNIFGGDFYIGENDREYFDFPRFEKSQKITKTS
jgi:hypothetical protein